MKHVVLIIVCGVLLLVAGCAINPRERILRQVQVGMAEDELRRTIEPIALDSGSVYWGGSGAKRLYFQISPTEQVWFEIGGSSNPSFFGRVIEIGPVEPKKKWNRSNDGSVMVESTFHER